METITASLSGLSQDGTSPAEGDEVDLVVKGTVQKIDGDKAIVQVTSVNDEPSEASPTSEGPSDSDAMGAALRGSAQSMDAQPTY